MPHRSKHDAETRLKIGMARALIREGKSAQEMLEAFREHNAIVQALESSQRSDSPSNASAPIAIKRS